MPRIILLLFIFLSATYYTSAQLTLRPKNRFDSENRKHGFWITYSRSNPKQKTFKGYFKHGFETGKCKYYADGKKCMKLRYVNDSIIRIVRYSSNGRPEYKGTALWLVNDEEMWYCWDGEFTFYGENRKVIRKATYIKGEEIEPDADLLKK